jgi:hypothetical protein
MTEFQQRSARVTDLSPVQLFDGLGALLLFICPPLGILLLFLTSCRIQAEKTDLPDASGMNAAYPSPPPPQVKHLRAKNGRFVRSSEVIAS